MSNDRELLEAVARAIGVDVLRWQQTYDGIPFAWARGPKIDQHWSPFTSDGDCYRLAKRLGISIDFSDCCAWKRLPNGELIQEWWGGECGDEAHAIVRVAAEIGKGMIGAQRMLAG